MPTVLRQGLDLSFASIRGPPAPTGGLSRLHDPTPAERVVDSFQAFPKGLHDMKTRLLIDGSSHTGNYRVICDCDDAWTGRAEAIGTVNWSPALPIAECVVHMKICHDGALIDLQFTDRFRSWLTSYWERANLRIMRTGGASTFGRHAQVAP
jgi:hypothetical protein